MKLIGLVSAVCFLAGVIAQADIIPANRRMDWSHAGVPGGIPNRTTIFVNVATTGNANYKCYGDGTTDNSAALQRAIADCPAGQVVYIPAGTYRLNSAVSGQLKNNITIRGDGQGQTIFMPYAVGGYGAFTFGSSDWPRPSGGVTITGGATNGSTMVTVGDTSAVNVGKFVRVDPVNPSWVHNLNGSDNNPTMSFMFKVVSKTATTVTLTPALPFDLSTMSPKLVPYSTLMVEGIGMENLTVNLDSNDSAAVYMEQGWGCWFKDIEIKNSNGRQMFLYTVCSSEIRQCYTHGTKSGGPNHEGIDFYGDGCWNLVEDNIVYNGGFPGIIVGDSKGGCQGNVFAYNYCGGVDVGSSDTTGCDISFSHGPHNMLNLAEGNVAGMIMSDGYFGSSSHNTIFRNWLTITHPTAIYGLRGVALLHYNTYYNVVGNILGTPDFPPNPNGLYSTETASYNNAIRLIYQLGYPNMGNTSHSGTTIGPTTPPDYTAEPFTLPQAQALDLNVKATLLRWGNYDYFNHAANWDSSEVPGDVPVPPDHNLPDSLYLGAKPSWWGNLPWPPFGPDISPMTNRIPAQVRYERGVYRSPHGVPYSWFNKYGITNNYAQVEETDPDNDGLKTWQEYFAGTDPTNRFSVFKIVDAGLSAGSASNMWVKWYGTTNSGATGAFEIYRSTNMVAGNWQLAGSNIARSSTGTNVWTNAIASGQGCYRIAIPNQ